jgi:hypothetical protein
MSKLDEAEDSNILVRAGAILHSALDAPESVDDDAFRGILAAAVRLYAAKADQGMRHPLPHDRKGLTIDETMVMVTDILHAMDVQLFELSMWQAMTGNHMAPHQRVDTADIFSAEPAGVSNPRLNGDVA